MDTLQLDWQPLPLPPALLGESPFWHPDEQALWWLDIPGCAVHRWDPATQSHRHWPQPAEPGCIAPLAGGGLLLARRDGLFRFDADSGATTRLAAPPYDPAQLRFNDGKADAHGRLWVGTIFDARTRPGAALYRFDGSGFERLIDEATISNGLAFSPDGHTVLWADTPTHQLMAYTLDAGTDRLVAPRVLQRFPPKQPGVALADQPGYQGRPDGAAMDVEGHAWVAMMEGRQLLRLAPDGRVVARVPLPVRCPTMPCFGGPDGHSLFVTTASAGRPPEELAAEPWAGCVLVARAPVAGLPVNFARA